MSNGINGFSIDLEDWFRVGNLSRSITVDSWETQESRIVRNTETLLALLDRTKHKATFFVLGWIAERHPTLIKRIAAEGHEIASHGSNHTGLRGYVPERLLKELRDEKSRLQDLTGKRVVGFRAPNFSIVKDTIWALEVLHETGFLYDSSVMPVHRRSYGMPGNPLGLYRIRLSNSREILEIAPSVISLLAVHIAVGGGGYFRLWPYPFTRWAAKRIEQSGRPFCFYIHPWEIDAEQPRLCGLKPFSAFKHYHNLDLTLGRLEMLLSEFRFATFQTIAEAVSSKTLAAPLIQL